MRFLIPWMALAGLVCADGVSDAKAKFEKMDRELNVTYAGLKKDLPAHLFSALQEDQREWVGYRDHISEFQAGEKDPEKSVERWETAAGMTESRIDWLKAWRRLPEGLENWAGRYSDGRGGVLEIVEQDGKTHFSLGVVRGPTYHSGSIHGVMQVNGGSARFETKSGEGERPTWLTFMREHDGTGRIRIYGENTGPFHGARAYFEGSYLRTGDVPAKERERVIKGETE